MYKNHTLLSESELRILDIFLDLGRHYFAEMAKKSKLTRPRTLRALRGLEKQGFLSTKTEANVKYYSLNNIPKVWTLLSLVEYNKAENFLEKNKTLKRALVTLTEKFDQNLVIAIFGSHVKGYTTKSSDVDILLMKEQFSKPEMKKIEDLIDIINGRTGLKLSHHIMNLSEFKKNELSREIIDKHILIEGGELFFKKVLE
jgi:predicted nucleotidyltransferase